MNSGRHLIKICGIGNSRDLESAAGADMVGVVIDVPASPRNRTWEEASALFEKARGRFVSVAVLLDPPATAIERAVASGAALVQVHGRVPTDLSAALRSRVVPSLGLPREGEVRVGQPAFSLPDMEGFPFVHLDVAREGSLGGKGEPLDRGTAHILVEDHPEVRFLLSGGLTPENVVGAIREICPAGVDVSSGVESSPGVKSSHKVAQFIRAVRSWEERHPHA